MEWQVIRTESSADLPRGLTIWNRVDNSMSKCIVKDNGDLGRNEESGNSDARKAVEQPEV